MEFRNDAKNRFRTRACIQRDQAIQSCSVTADGLLQRACTSARAAWPDIVLDDERFRAYVRERLPAEGDIELHWADLWLACACVDGIASAISTLERWGFPSVDAALAKLQLAEHDRAELKQRVRTRLLLPEGTRPPRLVEYSGRGDLRGYLRISATRLALNYLRDARRHEVPSGDELPNAIVDPELGRLQERYRGACELALSDALEQLSRRERNLLRQHLIDGTTIQQLATQHRVHRVTMSRWLEEARTAVLERVKHTLRERHGIGDDELASVVRLVRSQLDVSMSRRLRALGKP
jgi:RNA polymerase sigma-70 factor (ECF subfamily)